MQSILRYILLGLMGATIVMFSRPSSGAEMPQASQVEVEALLKQLATSGCQFNRNGTWYTGAEAQAHLSKKLAYVVEKKTANSAEQFIEIAATKSSMSGQAYQVKCGSAAAQSSAIWLDAALKELRTKKLGSSKP